MSVNLLTGYSADPTSLLPFYYREAEIEQQVKGRIQRAVLAGKLFKPSQVHDIEVDSYLKGEEAGVALGEKIGFGKGELFGAKEGFGQGLFHGGAAVGLAAAAVSESGRKVKLFKTVDDLGGYDNTRLVENRRANPFYQEMRSHQGINTIFGANDVIDYTHKRKDNTTEKYKIFRGKGIDDKIVDIGAVDFGKVKLFRDGAKVEYIARGKPP